MSHVADVTVMLLKTTTLLATQKLTVGTFSISSDV